jgi:hypothetical protein
MTSPWETIAELRRIERSIVRMILSKIHILDMRLVICVERQNSGFEGRATWILCSTMLIFVSEESADQELFRNISLTNSRRRGRNR